MSVMVKEAETLIELSYTCNSKMGSTDVLLILDKAPGNWDDMASNEKGECDTDHKHDVFIEVSVEDKPASGDEAQRKWVPSNCVRVLRTLFVIIGALGVILSVSLITLAILTSIATKAYDSEQSSRMAAMVLVAVSGAVTVVIIIYGEVAILTNQKRRICVVTLTLLILAITQSLISGICVNVEPADEAKLLKSLSESFKLAREENPRHLKIWAMTQSDLNCCGVYSPEDYRSSKLPYYFPPNVPISCCSTYDSSRSDLVQERDRELCKVKKTYYTKGCKDLVLMVFKETSAMVFANAILLVIFEVMLIIIGGVLCLHKLKKLEDGPKE